MITDQSHAVFYTLSLHDALPISRTSASYGYHRRFHKQVTACSDDGSNNHVGYAASGHPYRGRARTVAASGDCRDSRAVMLNVDYDGSGPSSVLCREKRERTVLNTPNCETVPLNTMAAGSMHGSRLNNTQI